MLLIFLFFIAISLGIVLSVHYWLTHKTSLHITFRLHILQPVAFLGFLTAFAAPAHFSYFNGNIVALFCYYLVLNLAVFFIAELKQWRELNYLAFLANFTFISLWNGYMYTRGHYHIAEIMLLLYFLLFLMISLLFSYRSSSQLKQVIIRRFTYALPMIFFICQAKLMNYSAPPLALTSLALAFLYAILAYFLNAFFAKSNLLLKSLQNCSLIFVTLSIVFLIPNLWLGPILALEGAILFLFGRTYAQKFSIYFGIFLQLFASIAFMNYFPRPMQQAYLINPSFIGSILIISAALYSAYLSKSTLRLGFFLVAALWSLFIGFYQNILYFQYHPTHPYLGIIISHVQEWQVLYCSLLYFAVFSLILCALAKRFHFRSLISSLGFFILFFIVLELYHLNFYAFYNAYHPFVYIAALFIGYCAFYLIRHVISTKMARFFAGGLWLAFLSQYALWVLYFNHVVIPDEYSLQSSIFAIAISLYFLVFECDMMIKIFPCSFHPDIYTRSTPKILCLVFVFWLLATSISATGAVPHWPYIPLLNPLDLSTALGFFSIYYWGKPQAAWLRSQYSLRSQHIFKVLVWVLLAIWLAAMVYRTLYQWTAWFH